MSAGEVIEILVRFGWLAIGHHRRLPGEGCELVLVDGLFHAVDAEEAPFVDCHFVDVVAFGEVAGAEVGARGFDERG